MRGSDPSTLYGAGRTANHQLQRSKNTFPDAQD